MIPRSVRLFGTYGLLIAGSAIVLGPVYLALINALLPAGELASYPPNVLPTGFGIGSFGDAWDAVPMGRYLLNSFIMATGITVLQVATSVLAGYALACMRFPGRTVLFAIFIGSLMVPWEVSIVPNFQTVRSLGWLDTYQGLIVPFAATALGIFLLRQQFLTLPSELRDAAAMDGYGHLRFLWFVGIPLARPAIGSLAVFSFLSAWNQYLWPLLVTNDDNHRTIQIGLALLSRGEIDRVNVVMAGTIIALVPTLILLLVFQRQLVRGLTAGAVKG
ncbi:MAG: carbohydrate ABC transporter permease [Dehalococcoidia bacterium]|nr:carbohydrate ABC transporter permease [Dehalococcoidia bacterium]